MESVDDEMREVLSADGVERPLGTVAFGAVVAQHPLVARIRALEAALAEAEATIAGMGESLAQARALAGQLETALESSREIGAAIGILMAQRKVTRAGALDILTRASQRGHVKIRDLAVHIVDTGAVDVA